MANLAIRGHETRGKEVIEILEMLGGKNYYNFTGGFTSNIYFINKSGFIFNDYDTMNNLNYFQITLEEFLEKYPYKVGDKIYNIIHNEPQIITKLAWDTQENEVSYQTYNNEYLYVNYLQPYKEETMEENLEQMLIPIPKGYELSGINDDNKIVLTKKQLNYPKTYEECADILHEYTTQPNITGYEYELLHNLRKLLICRDGYLKFAGYCKPDWEKYKLNEVTYCLHIVENKVEKSIFYNENHILVFPTEEMCDAFYENFKDLIEACKEFL